MPDMTNNTIAFYGIRQNIKELDALLKGSDIVFNLCNIKPIPNEISDDQIYKWKMENWGTTWCEHTDHECFDFNESAILKLSFNTLSNPPLKVLDNISEKFPEIRFICRSTLERDWYETTVIRREPSRGCQKCLVDSPFRINDDSGEYDRVSIDVLDEFLLELSEDQQLRTASELIGITVDRIIQRKSGTLAAI